MQRGIGVVALLLAGCVGEAEFQMPPSSGEPQSQPDVQMPDVVKVGSFSGATAGLPSTEITSTAQLDGQLWAVTGGGLYALPSGASSWVAVTLPLTGAEKVTSISRIDTTLYVTVADDTGHGGLIRRAFSDDDFSRSMGAPNAAMYAVVKKSGELLVSSSAGLLASVDKGSTFVTRSTAALFLKPVRSLIAAASAVRIFAVSDTKALWYSDDVGMSWVMGPVNGEVRAVQASNEFVLVQTERETVRSDNYGNTFRPIDVGGATLSLAVSGKRAFAGTMTGVRVSADGGATWTDASTGLPAAAEVRAVFLAGNALIASANQQVYVAQVE